jgi:hypothetical protein
MTMTTLQHQNCMEMFHNPVTQGLGLRKRPDDLRVEVRSVDALKSGRYVKTMAHDNIFTPNVPLTCRAFCFPRFAKEALPSEVMPRHIAAAAGKQHQMKQFDASRAYFPPNTISAVPKMQIRVPALGREDPLRDAPVAVMNRARINY